MEGIRRTIPRSARRDSTRNDRLSFLSQHPITSEANRYVPEFSGRESGAMSRFTDVKQIEVQPRTSPDPVYCFNSAPQRSVRWMPTAANHAIAVVGSADGEEDFLTFYAVTAKPDVEVKCIREAAHSGEINKLCVTEDSQIFTASSNGTIYTTSGKEDETSAMRKVYDMEKHGKVEGISSVARTSIGLVAGGVHGSLMIIDIETGQASGLQFDEVGFRDLISVDECGSEIITAGCDVAVWDVRSGDRIDLNHPGKGVATCVATDPGQPHFVMGGMRHGELVIWDRRSDSVPLNRVGLHCGPMWDLGVVSSYRAGMLLCCGEDGNVNLVDFAAAGDRGGFGSIERAFCEQGEFWRSSVLPSDVASIAHEPFAINGVSSHRDAALFAYATDSGTVGFARLNA